MALASVLPPLISTLSSASTVTFLQIQEYLHAEEMVEPQVKVEGDLPRVQVSNSMDADKQIMDEPGAAQEATNIPANTNPSPTCPESQITNKIEPLWKLCDDRPRVQQVQINEEAAEHSRIYFEGVETILKEHSSEFISCETRLREIGKLPKNTLSEPLSSTF